MVNVLLIGRALEGRPFNVETGSDLFAHLQKHSVGLGLAVPIAGATWAEGMKSSSPVSCDMTSSVIL